MHLDFRTEFPLWRTREFHDCDSPNRIETFISAFGNEVSAFPSLKAVHLEVLIYWGITGMEGCTCSHLPGHSVAGERLRDALVRLTQVTGVASVEAKKWVADMNKCEPWQPTYAYIFVCPWMRWDLRSEWRCVANTGMVEVPHGEVGLSGQEIILRHWEVWGEFERTC